MNELQKSIAIIFQIEDWEKDSSFIHDRKLEKMEEIIPDFDYYSEKFPADSPRFKDHVKHAQRTALAWEKEGKDLYMITDDPDYIHFCAIFPEYKTLIKVLDKYIFNLEMLEKINAIDMVWED